MGQRLWLVLLKLVAGTPTPNDDAAGPQFYTIALRHRDRILPEGPALTEDEAYLRTLNYATEAGLEGEPMGRYVKRMTYGDYATATGGRLSEEVLGWDVWVVALAANLKYLGLLSEHMRDHQRTFNYVAIVLEAVGGEIISTAFFAESGEQRPFSVG